MGFHPATTPCRAHRSVPLDVRTLFAGAKPRCQFAGLLTQSAELREPRIVSIRRTKKGKSNSGLSHAKVSENPPNSLGDARSAMAPKFGRSDESTAFECLSRV